MSTMLLWVGGHYLQQHQNAMHAMVKTVMSKLLEKSRLCQRDLRCSMVTGSHLDGVDLAGANLEAPMMTLFSIQPPCQGASLISCQRCKPSSQDFMVPLPTEAVPLVEINKDKRDSEAGMHSVSGTLWSSQNLVKWRRPAE